MAFGRKGLGTDPRLEAQKSSLRESAGLFENLEQRLRDVDELKSQFADVWPADGLPADFVSMLDKWRELSALLHQRVAGAQAALPDFDDAAEFLRQEVVKLDGRWKGFVALLIARQAILRGEAKSVAASAQPSMLDCQRALLDIAEELYESLRRHVDELAGIKPRFDGPWPDLLDLDRIEAGTKDTRKALDIYRQRLWVEQGELPEASTASFMDIISMLQNSILIIEDQRTDLAVHIATKSALRNTGFA